MKGVVFAELLSMADESMGEKRVDKVLARCPLASGGAYTTVGIYDSAELGILVKGFSDEAGVPPDVLQRQFGHRMLHHFQRTYPQFFAAKPDAFSMLESIETEVHMEVRKLNASSELPRFDTERVDVRTLKLTYSSPRRLTAFCLGLIEGCLAHYGESAVISLSDRSTAEQAVIDFLIVRDA